MSGGEMEFGLKLVEGAVTVALGEALGHNVSHTVNFVTVKVRGWYAAWRNFEQVAEQDLQQVEQEFEGLWHWAVEITE